LVMRLPAHSTHWPLVWQASGWLLVCAPTPACAFCVCVCVCESHGVGVQAASDFARHKDT
jgi:hypothetical protein